LLEKRVDVIKPTQDKQAKVYFWIGLFFTLGTLGLPLIGVTLNVWLGGAFLAGAFACLVRALWIWEGSLKLQGPLRVATVAFTAIVYFGLVGWQILRQYKSNHPQFSATSLSVELHKGLAPSVFPPGGRINVLDTFAIPANAGGGGLGELSGTPGKEVGWPLGQTALQFQVTDYSSSTIFNVAAALQLKFFRVTKDKSGALQKGEMFLERQWEMEIPKIDSGADHPFVFYAINQKDDQWVAVEFPQSVKGQVGIESGERLEIGVLQPPPSPTTLLPPLMKLKPELPPDQNSEKQRILLLANQLQLFYRERSSTYRDQGILLYPDTDIARGKRTDFDAETIHLFAQKFGRNLDAIVRSLQLKGLDPTYIKKLRQAMESQQSLPIEKQRPSQAFVLLISQELRNLAEQIDSHGNLIH